MSYCLAIQTDHGLVFASDSRTHGGVEQVNTYSKMQRFEVSGERLFVLLSAGEPVHHPERRASHSTGSSRHRRRMASCGRPRCSTPPNTWAARAGRFATGQRAHEGDATFDASFLLGGQIRGRPPEICLIYPEGNCIRAPIEKPFLQIGETQ